MNVMRNEPKVTTLKILMGLLGLLLAVAAAAQAGSTSLKATDKTFVRKAGEGGLAEVELGKLAAAKANDPEVKAFGQRMVDDHSKANDKLRQVAATKGVDLPTDLTASDKTQKARLDKLSGAAFDRAYVRLMLKDHQKDVTEFQREAKRAAADADVKGFAADALPTLQDHLKMVQDLSVKVGVKPTGSSARTARPSHESGSSTADLDQ